jgi:hypothetical protein
MRLTIKDLFHVGVSRALDLKSRAAPVVRRWWPAWRDEGFTFLSVSESGMLWGLMQRVPQYCAADRPGGPDFRDFQTMDDVKRTGDGLDEVIAAAEACFGVLGISAPVDAGLDTEQAHASGLEELTLRSLLATGFVNFEAKGAFDISPVQRDRIEVVCERQPGERTEGEMRLKPAAVSRFLGWLRKRSEQAGVGWPALERYARKALGDLEFELKGVRTLTDLDPRYFRSMILSRERGHGFSG